MNWLEVSLVVDGELAEAVADVLARFAPNGVMTEQGVSFNGEEDEGTAAGPITVRAYLGIDDQLEETRQKIEESLYFLGMIQPVPAPAYRQIVDENWMEAWRQHYRPIRVGKSLLILPAWLDSPDPDRIPIRIDPGMAFGTGTHPTTQLSLELMEKYFLEGRPRYEGSKPAGDQAGMIDVGCGSGILSIAAIKLGAGKTLGVDIDVESVKNSRQNADLNGVGDELSLGQGSVAEVLAGKFDVKSAPLVAANILAPILIRLLDAGLADLIQPHGEIILSGILDTQAEKVIRAGQMKGLKMEETRQLNDWVAISMKK